MSFRGNDNGGSLPAVTISPISAPGGIGLTIKDGNTPANTMLQVENIGLDASHYAPTFVLSGSNGGIYNGSSFPGGQTWSMGIDTAAATPYRDFFIAKVGDWNGSTPGAVFDFFYIAHRGTLPPSIQIGTSSAFTPDGLVELIQTCDNNGNVRDTNMTNLVIRTGAITAGGAVTTPQTAPAIRMRNWASASDRFLLDYDASVRIFDAGGTGLVSIIGTSGKTGIGKDAYNQATDTLRLKENAADTTLTVASTSGGAFKATAFNGSANVDLATTNASTLTIKTNSTQAIKITTAQSVLLGVTAPATTATDGFPYIPATAGAPTGVPTSQTGYAAMRYDTTNHKLWIYDGGWKGVVVA